MGSATWWPSCRSVDRPGLSRPKVSKFKVSAVVAPVSDRRTGQRWDSTGRPVPWRLSMAHSLWSDRPLGVKLGALVAAGAVSLGAFAMITVQALNGTGDTTRQILATGKVSASASEADMMHDAIRADVLQALVNSKGQLYQSAVDDSAAHSATFQQILTGITGDHLGAGVDSAVG